METRTYTFVSTAAVKAVNVIGISETRCNNVIIQSGEANLDNVYFGDSGSQDAYILPLGNATLDIGDVDHLWIKGSTGEKVIFIIER